MAGVGEDCLLETKSGHLNRATILGVTEQQVEVCMHTASQECKPYPKTGSNLITG